MYNSLGVDSITVLRIVIFIESLHAFTWIKCTRWIRQQWYCSSGTNVNMETSVWNGSTGVHLHMPLCSACGSHQEWGDAEWRTGSCPGEWLQIPLLGHTMAPQSAASPWPNPARTFQNLASRRNPPSALLRFTAKLVLLVTHVMVKAAVFLCHYMEAHLSVLFRVLTGCFHSLSASSTCL